MPSDNLYSLAMLLIVERWLDDTFPQEPVDVSVQLLELATSVLNESYLDEEGYPDIPSLLSDLEAIIPDIDWTGSFRGKSLDFLLDGLEIFLERL